MHRRSGRPPGSRGSAAPPEGGSRGEDLAVRGRGTVAKASDPPRPGPGAGKNTGGLKAHGWLGLLILLGTGVGLVLRSDWVRGNLYFLFWWAYILVVDALVHRRRGASLIVDRGRAFLGLLAWSVVIWLVFEDFNFILRDWYYVNVPAPWAARWLGYAFAYATVLPGIFETLELLESLGLWHRWRVKALQVTPALLRALEWTGAASFVLPLVFPRYFFPLIWGSFTFLLEPLLYRRGGRSLLREWEQGSLRKFFLVLASGAVCGFLWESWNYPATVKWIYTVPFFQTLKWFEMPPLGFLGFPPFAVECYVMVNALCLLLGGPNWEDPPAPARPALRGWRRAVLALAILVFSLAVFHGIDVHTVDSFQVSVAELPGLSPGAAEALREQGVETPRDLLRAARRPAALSDLARDTNLSPDVLRRAAQAARLITLRGLGLENYRQLRAAGIESVRSLAAADPVRLYDALRRLPGPAQETSRLSPAKVRIWVAAARRRVRSRG